MIGLITFLSYTGTVYTKVCLYLLELSFLVNCLVLAASNGIIGSAMAEGEQPIRAILTFTSVGIAFATFIGVLVYHTLTQMKNSRVWMNLKLQ